MLKYSDLGQDQLDAIDFILNGEDTLLCGDVGCGKTAIAYTAGKLSLIRGEVTRWLVLAPLLVATDTWALEASEWEHLDPDDVAIACGTEEDRLTALYSTAKFVVMNYENLPWLLDLYDKHPTRGDSLPFDGLICDELDKLKSVSSNRFKAFRNRIKIFKKRVGMTGTILPNNLTELWGQVYMVDGGESFGRSYYKWRSEFFYPIDYQQRRWMPFEKTHGELIRRISDMSIRLRAKNMPKVIALEPDRLVLPDSVRDRYDELEKEYFLVVEDLHGVSRKIDAANAAVLTGKLQQICAGFSYVDGGKEAVWHSTARFDWLYHKLGALIGSQVLIFYHFNEELAKLKELFDDVPHLGKGVTDTVKREHIRRWNKGEIDILALHPASAGHGLNLQKSGAHDIVFLTLPWSGGMYKQVVGRLRRRGQSAKEIIVHTALFENTIDWNVFNAVTGKMVGLETFLDDLETACSLGKTA